jgi:hypothetical protein
MDFPGVGMDTDEIGGEKPAWFPIGGKVAAAEVCWSGFGSDEDVLWTETVFVFGFGQKGCRLNHGGIGKQFVIAPKRRWHEDGLSSVQIR